MTTTIQTEGIIDVCPLRNAFGISGKGIHSYRIYDVAVLDFAVTLVGAVILAFVFSWPIGWTFLGLFLLGIFVHRIFYARTTIDKLLFSGPRDGKCPANDAHTASGGSRMIPTTPSPFGG